MGATGATGDTGAQGVQGSTGATGADGALSAWGKAGTAGTNPTTDFAGTTDAVAFAIRTNNIERMRILPSGSIGVGTSTPVAIGKVFQVSANDAGGTSLFLENSGSGGKNWRMLSTGTGNTGGAGSLMIVNHTDDAANPKLMISATGNIGIGTATPNTIGKTLHIASTNTGGTSLFLENTKSWRMLSTGTGNTGGSGNLLIVNHSDDAANPKFTISTSGNVGVGTVVPSAKLDVNGNVKIANDLTLGGNFTFGGNKTISYLAATALHPEIFGFGRSEEHGGCSGTNPPFVSSLNQFSYLIQSWGVNSLYSMSMGFNGNNAIIETAGSDLSINNECGKNIKMCTSANGGNVSLCSGAGNGSVAMCNGGGTGSVYMCSPTSGFVCIGTTIMPSGYKLAVNGKIICEEVNVKLFQNWPDYVFDKKYKLMSIEDLQEFTKKEKHLPGMPSADEVEKNGINTAEMITKLLKTQEEQAQYIFQLNEQNIILKKEIEKLKK